MDADRQVVLGEPRCRNCGLLDGEHCRYCGCCPEQECPDWCDPEEWERMADFQAETIANNPATAYYRYGWT